MAATAALAVLVLAASFGAVRAADEGADKAANGYARARLDGTGIALLLPAGWRVDVGQAKLMPSLVARESGRADGAVLTVNVISNLAKTRFRLVSEQLARYADDLVATGGIELLAREPLRRGRLVGESLLLRWPPESSAAATGGQGGTASVDGARLERRLYLADDRRDWLVVASFRVGSARWAALEELRRTVLGSLSLD